MVEFTPQFGSFTVSRPPMRSESSKRNDRGKEKSRTSKQSSSTVFPPCTPQDVPSTAIGNNKVHLKTKKKMHYV